VPRNDFRSGLWGKQTVLLISLLAHCAICTALAYIYTSRTAGPDLANRASRVIQLAHGSCRLLEDDLHYELTMMEDAEEE